MGQLQLVKVILFYICINVGSLLSVDFTQLSTNQSLTIMKQLILDHQVLHVAIYNCDTSHFSDGDINVRLMDHEFESINLHA